MKTQTSTRPKSNSQDIVSVALPRQKWVAIIGTINQRQRDCRAVTEEYPQHEKYAQLDIEYEKLKMQIANQLPAAS